MARFQVTFYGCTDVYGYGLQKLDHVCAYAVMAKYNSYLNKLFSSARALKTVVITTNTQQLKYAHKYILQYIIVRGLGGTLISYQISRWDWRRLWLSRLYTTGIHRVQCDNIGSHACLCVRCVIAAADVYTAEERVPRVRRNVMTCFFQEIKEKYRFKLKSAHVRNGCDSSDITYYNARYFVETTHHCHSKTKRFNYRQSSAHMAHFFFFFLPTKLTKYVITAYYIIFDKIYVFPDFSKS